MRMPAVARRIAVAAAIAFVVCGAAAAPAATATPPPGYARIWIYRFYEPYVTLARPYMRLNGRIVGISEPGGAFYRDVAPGVYRVTIDSRGEDANQFATVGLVAGQTVYVRVDADKFWAAINPNYQVDTFYTYPIPVPLARAEMAGLPVYGGP